MRWLVFLARFKRGFMVKSFMFAAPLVMAVGCKTQAPNYCEDAPFHDCRLVDAGVDAAKKCESNAECQAPAAVCDVAGTKTCVECTATDDAVCMGAEPVCGADNACRKCAAHSECDSQVCLPDGTCAASNSVAYVDGAAPAANTACTLVSKCNTVTKALAANKPMVKIAGTVDDRVSIQNKNVQLIGDAGAKLTSSSTGVLLSISGSSVVSVWKLHVANAVGGAPLGVGVQAQLTGGSLTLTESKVSGCQETGVTVTGGTVAVTRSEIVGNRGGGMTVASAIFKISNTVIADNGDVGAAGSDIGGITLSSSSSGNIFDDNTIVANRNRAAAADTPGIKCAVANFIARRNIVTSNAQNTTYPAQLQGGCVFEQSFVEPGSDVNALKFADPARADYHLTAASPASVRDVPGVTTCSGVDLDGDARPQNGLCDLGADEFKP